MSVPQIGRQFEGAAETRLGGRFERPCLVEDPLPGRVLGSVLAYAAPDERPRPSDIRGRPNRKSRERALVLLPGLVGVVPLPAVFQRQRLQALEIRIVGR